MRPIGPLDGLCTTLACLANDLAHAAQHQRTARAARLATLALEAAVLAHQLDATIARLVSEAAV